MHDQEVYIEDIREALRRGAAYEDETPAEYEERVARWREEKKRAQRVAEVYGAVLILGSLALLAWLLIPELA